MEIVWAVLLMFGAVLAFMIWRIAGIVSGSGGDGTTPSRAKGDKIYYLELVGEQHYRDATKAARVGDEVEVLSEEGNPHDPEALVVCDMAGRTLGYVQRGSWLHRALLMEGKGCEAYVDELKAQRGYQNVRISVTLTKDGPVETRDYSPAS